MDHSGKEYYDGEYMPGVIRWGRMTSLAGLAFSFVPVLLVTFVFGIIPGVKPLTAALASQLSVNVVWWFLEPVTYFPILGIPGTYLAFLTGNVSNLRLPCAGAAVEVSGVKPGTREGVIVSTIGICASIFVNTSFLTVGVALGASALSKLPPGLVENLSFVLPALFGAVFAQFAVEDRKTAACAIVIGVSATLLYRFGLLAFLPGDPSYAVVLLSVFGTILAARLMVSSDCPEGSSEGSSKDSSRDSSES